jgi:putative hydrolase of the HAD superfamily
MSRQTLIVDLDGTIVKCGRYYNQANAMIAAGIAEAFGVREAHARELMEWLDVWAIRAQAEAGFTRERFPRSMGAAVLAAGVVMADRADPAIAHWAYKTADAVFEAPYEPFDGALDALRAYRDAGWRLVVYTKGDPEIQARKVDINGIRDLVDAVEITPAKTVDTLRALLERHDVDVLASAYVGDSVRDDMTPANALGLYAVRVRQAPEDHWGHEALEDAVSDAVIDALADLPRVLAPAGGNPG